MSQLSDLSDPDLRALHERVREEHAAFVKRGLKLNMARGKPAPEQLDLSEALLRLPGEGEHAASDGTDVRNYGGLAGLPETRALFAQILDVDPRNVIVAGNSSLSMMHDHVVFALLKGVPDSPQPWGREPIKFLCPVPGYDRHFSVCEEHGIEMIPVPMDDEGPVMDEVERLVKEDASIKGMWCVPKYSNPTGVVYSPDVVRRLAAMETAAPDFRILWDNAYVVHHLTEERIELTNLVTACAEAGHPNRPLVFASTSKVTFAGGGLAAFTSSRANVDWFVARMSKRMIGPDKVNQLRHAKLLPDLDAVHRLMDAHREILAPKFRTVIETFTAKLSDPRVARWTEPKGGYFISLDLPPGCAKRCAELAKEAGIVMTPAGAAFPYKKDPEDRNLRIAPSFPSAGEVAQAAEGIAVSALVAATEKALADR
ncbi:MAG TPA: aminotransferase class I/II-fold pyridoxal phosphate-dependent enzyme [Sandaracinaceae bacterium LLY-WYZ-13_1]|nr:aminotransferase class I/II-fold pyridoxal phosphate-dependent enzyme [Sandaracinaceae bacterium LLY-WYZ-13_1]